MRTIRETQIMAHSPCFVTPFMCSIDVTSNFSCIVMAYANKGDLFRYVEKQHTLLSSAQNGISLLISADLSPNSLSYRTKTTLEKRIWDIEIDLLDTSRNLISLVKHLHQSQAQHLDIKLENILMTNDGNLLLTDAGISRIPGISNAIENPEERFTTSSLLHPDVTTISTYKNGYKADIVASAFSVLDILTYPKRRISTLRNFCRDGDTYYTSYQKTNIPHAIFSLRHYFQRQSSPQHHPVVTYIMSNLKIRSTDVIHDDTFKTHMTHMATTLKDLSLGSDHDLNDALRTDLAVFGLT